ncbi:hypothetical protein OG819_34755 [Streptomyces sp. NBC_01549]|uniref:hypothetical protein n=1 Tax=Streptomyces sp. NBC_01549 TaxID=2975874 RepID=UPI00225BF9C1|nr:hypothetical protein [Streptomyces sp. NBC_01549]MCX4594696.1 hypothetical protein [Streptomyces sp. NBC_01549]
MTALPLACMPASALPIRQNNPYVPPSRYGDALADQVGVFGEQHDGREDAGQLQDADVAEVVSWLRPLPNLRGKASPDGS